MTATAPALHAPAGAIEKPRPYSESAIPEPFRILGLKLLPFSFGHYLLLKRFDCAFVAEDERYADRDDVLIGVLICSMSPSDFLEFIESKGFKREVREWGKKTGLFSLKEKAALFQKYLRSGWQEPPHINKAGGRSTGDWVQNVKITLQAKLGYTDDEVMSMPMSKAMADYYKLAESEGAIHLLTPHDLESMDANAKAMEAL